MKTEQILNDIIVNQISCGFNWFIAVIPSGGVCVAMLAGYIFNRFILKKDEDDYDIFRLMAVIQGALALFFVIIGIIFTPTLSYQIAFTSSEYTAAEISEYFTVKNAEQIGDTTYYWVAPKNDDEKIKEILESKLGENSSDFS